MKIPRIMLAGTSSGCGKTTVTCAVLQALVNRGMRVGAFKCGPDYIDPMFHSRIIGAKSANLDLHFFPENTLRYLLTKNAETQDVSIIEGVMGYYDGMGLTTTRASSYEVAKVTDSPVVLVINAKGASLSILATIHAYCEAVRPKLAVELAPTFSEYSLGLKRIGCGMEQYYLTPENDFALDDGFLKFLAERKPEAVFLCNPNNPTGKIIPPELMKKILELCSKQDTPLFVDECFLDLSDSGESLKQHLANFRNLFILKAFTKSYGMAGIRLGYCLCADGALLAGMATASQPWNVSSLAQAAGVAALQEKAFLQKTKDLVAVERQWLKRELDTLGFRVIPSSVNYLLFQAQPDLYTKLKEKKIAIRNCDNYFGLGPGWYRIAVRLHKENEALIRAIKEV